MTWGQEIFRALLLTFGVTEIITNMSYLTRKNGLDLARKQHGELPPRLPSVNLPADLQEFLTHSIQGF